MPALAIAYFIPSKYQAIASIASEPAMLDKRDVDGGAVGVILILLTISCVLAVFFFVVCIKQAQARRREKRGRRAGSTKRRRDIPLAQRTYRANIRTANAPEPVGLGISGLDEDLEAGPELPAPTPPPPSYHTNSLRSQRSDRSGASRHEGLASRTMRTGTARSDRPRPSQSINQYLQSQAAARSGSGEGKQPGAPATAEARGNQRHGSAGSREPWES